MGSKMERGTEKYIVLHMCLLHWFCWGGFNLEEEGSTLHDSVAWRSYHLLFILYDLWFLPVSAPIASPEWICAMAILLLLARGKTHCERRNHTSCMRRSGRYVFEVECTYVDVM
ncbi:hypothetical protein TcCL_Unassigned00673 [Trypanosoma cruzi]|nr:hypothetical protein TcCL_Unassigned00673 [Trypanosoma cruzi]